MVAPRRSLWSRSREVVWALNSISHHRQRGAAPFGVHKATYGVTVVVAKPAKSWGNTTHQRPTGPVSHVPTRIYIAYRDGKVVGQQVRWLCGSHTTEFVLTDTRVFRPCPSCYIRTEEAKAQLETPRLLRSP